MFNLSFQDDNIHTCPKVEKLCWIDSSIFIVLNIWRKKTTLGYSEHLIKIAVCIRFFPSILFFSYDEFFIIHF